MPRKRFTNEQIAFALPQPEHGASVDEVCRKRACLRSLRCSDRDLTTDISSGTNQNTIRNKAIYSGVIEAAARFMKIKLLPQISPSAQEAPQAKDCDASARPWSTGSAATILIFCSAEILETRSSTSDPGIAARKT